MLAIALDEDRCKSWQAGKKEEKGWLGWHI
jgi:hypothetical protein